MRKSDAICPKCGAGFRRIELTSKRGGEGQYRCPSCDTLIENFDGRNFVAYRLTIEPMKKTKQGGLPHQRASAAGISLRSVAAVGTG
jgi:transposase-like protein